MDQARCERHPKAAERFRERDRRRVGHHFYKTRRWQDLRKQQLSEHPFCQCGDCLAGRGRRRLATVVDHHRPHVGDEELFFDPGNLRSMFKPHHDRKTAREDGGFGNAAKIA